MKNIFIIVLSVFIITTCGGKEVKNPADMVLTNGNIYTLDDSIPRAEAIAIKDGKILSCGTNEEIKNFVDDSTEVIDLDGKFVMPGFVESHAHFLGLGNLKQILDLRDAKNWDEVITIVAKAAENSMPGQWIIGRGWHQEKFNPVPFPNVDGYPVHTVLSGAVPNNPVMLSHASGHAIFANAKAMQLAGITKSTPDPEGGIIVRDSLGEAIGVFTENAENLIRKIYDEYLLKRSPKKIRADYVRQIQLASEECLKKGITTFVDAGETFEIIDLMKELADSNKIPIRLYVMIGDSLHLMKEKHESYKLIGYGNNHLTVRSIKQYVDGALGSRGAWMLEPYNDLPEHYGSNVTSLSELEEIYKLAVNNGFQICTHAIGDRGNREVLNLYEEIFNGKKNLRWRIEHAQHLSAQDIPRFSKLGVIAAMQGVHCTSDATFVPERIGNERAEEGAYVWRKLIDSGAIICNGTDSPVEDVDPVKCFYASVTRKLADGTEFYSNQKMTREEAIKSYTINGAYAAFEENIKGTITPGKLADIVVLSNDLLNCSDEDILHTKVLYTIVGGKILYNTK
ncbi:MAG: amidohydrolase [Bacteroidota bacterium]